MLRAGYIRKLASGLYTWMPLGLRVLRKVEAMVREEMDRSGGIELLMPAVQPAELWQETGRWEVFGPQMLKIKDRHDNLFCFGPTHEEVITDIARREVKSYRQLPLNFYQIQTKFRDEVRPRFGVMRAREFVMKDAYSFHSEFCEPGTDLPRDVRDLQPHFHPPGLASSAPWQRTPARSAAPARTNSMCWPIPVKTPWPSARLRITPPMSNWPKQLRRRLPRAVATETMRDVDTPRQTTCEEVAALLGIPLQRTVKLLAVMAAETSSSCCCCAAITT